MLPKFLPPVKRKARRSFREFPPAAPRVRAGKRKFPPAISKARPPFRKFPKAPPGVRGGWRTFRYLAGGAGIKKAALRCTLVAVGIGSLNRRNLRAHESEKNDVSRCIAIIYFQPCKLRNGKQKPALTGLSAMLLE
ncbi:MAG: hypothetical protein EZS26_001779 [Candidatus Ordinivivax streblomastigis]|uniref:Uncharacterized protein n=1 Tax=Candidatus Ordinivivax streblomastigis TaxID=2540710 RepID=A0A5M8P0K4_9BACT|nr:MAG: hypothetical protein EZS26_001779 [Candidatus Ordinivivax streblomastigis]